MLALAAVIPVTGWAARRLGTRRLYLISLVLFTLGSILCGFAWSIDSLIVFRVLQGLGGGMLMPTGMIILARAAGPQRMGRILSAIGVPMVLAPVFGPVARRAPRRARRLALDLLRQRPRRHRRGRAGAALPARPDGPRKPGRSTGSASSSSRPACPTLTYGLAKAGSGAGFASPQALVPIAVGLLLTTLFVFHSLRSSAPAAQRAPLREPRLRGRLGDDVLPRSHALRRHDPAAALLPDRATTTRSSRPACCSCRRASAPRSRCRSPAGSPTATAAARSRSPG